jgi:hypothetical protein
LVVDNAPEFEQISALVRGAILCAVTSASTRSLPQPRLPADRHEFETRSLPRSLAATRRGFTFYVAVPTSSIETCSVPGSLAATLAALPSISLIPSARFTKFALIAPTAESECLNIRDKFVQFVSPPATLVALSVNWCL